MKDTWKLLAAVCALVIGVYAYMSLPGDWEKYGQNPADSSYNLLVQGFRAGQLSLKKEVPPGLAQLADPYDPAANEAYRFVPYNLHDLCYYKGRIYSYYGVTPALILFWPFVALIGHYLSHCHAVLVFCTVGFITSAALLYSIWRKCFVSVHVGVVAVCVIALGLATGALLHLSRAGFYEVASCCGYALTMLALAAIWKALHEPEREWRWLAAASVAYGLAVGARPSLLFGAVILLVPVIHAWRERRRIWALLLAATGPMLLIGLGLMLYNALRFDNPFEFGWYYSLSTARLNTRQAFSLRYLWFNFRVYFLEPARWSARFPFAHTVFVSPWPAGYTTPETPFGILTNIPLVWLALVVPLAWRSRTGQAGSVLRWFVTAVALLFGTCALTLGLFCSASYRYEVDFLPALVLLAVVGILGLERVLVDRPAWRRAARLGWGVLLGFSVAFSLLVTAGHFADAQNNLGNALVQAGKPREAIAHCEQALRIKPDYAEAHYNLGLALAQTGKIAEAIAHYEQALRLKPGFAETHYNLGNVLLQAGRVQDGIGHYEQALRINPDFAEAHNNLGLALWQTGKVPEAIGHYEQALRLNPADAEAHNNLGLALAQTGKVPEAIGHYEQALRIRPLYADAHYNLGNALVQSGKPGEAIAQYKQALQIKPDYAEAHVNLGGVLLQAGQVPEAIAHYEQVLRIRPDFAEAHYALGIALEQAGRAREAIGHYEQALRIKPDYAAAKQNLARLQAGQ